jgi:hypothetical protein
MKSTENNSAVFKIKYFCPLNTLEQVRSPKIRRQVYWTQSFPSYSEIPENSTWSLQQVLRVDRPYGLHLTLLYTEAL